MGFLSSIIKNIMPNKFRIKLNPFTEKFKQETQSLIYPTEEGTAIPPGRSVLPPRVPLPPGVYEEIIQKRRFKFVEGFWKKPELSAVDLAKIKKKFILAGYDWPVKPHADLSRKFKNVRTTFHHPEKIKRMEKIETCMKNMPELLNQYKLKLEKEKSDEEAKSFKTEQEIYVDALNAGKRETPEWVQENIRQAKLKKHQAKQLVLAAKKKKKK